MLSEIRKIRDEVKLQLEELGISESTNDSNKKESTEKEESDNKILSELEKSRLEITSLTDSVIRLANKKSPDVNIDISGIIKALSELKNYIPKYEKQEVTDYTELLGEVIRNIEKPGYDYSKIEKLLDVISKKEVVLPLDEKGRVMVSVDKVSMGGRGSLSSTESAKLLTLATEAKQDTIVTALGEYAINATSVDASSSGDNTIVSITNTPKLYYICLSANGANGADVTAIVKIGATTKYKVSLKAGAIWARNIGAEKRYVTGSAGEDIIVNLSAAQTVHVSVEYAD